MRTIVFLMLLLITLTACAAKEEMTPEEAAQIEAAEAEGADAGEAAQADAAADADSEEALPEATLDENLQLDPIGEMKLINGKTYNIFRLEPLDKYYIYIVGKLNGRSSTVISLTRIRDLRRWAGISFKDPSSFVIVTQGEKELSFTDSRMYIGSSSNETFSFWTMEEDYSESLIEVNKKDVSMIAFKPVEE